MRLITKLVAPAALIGLSTACLTIPPKADTKEVQERYPHRVQGECHSWLRSSRTNQLYCASPAFDAEPPVDLVAAAAAKPKPVADGPVELGALQTAGEDVYGRVCVACHQADGKGLPGAFPPLAGAGDFYGTPENMAGIVINGLSGEIEVAGQKFNGMMPPQGGALSDYEIAAVLTYVRTNFGNDDGMVTPDQVKSQR